MSAPFSHPSRAYTETLGAELDERREDVDNEAIVDALDHIFDPAAVPHLRRAVRFIPESDEFGQLARKAVRALDRIHTPEALEAIREEVIDDLADYVVEAAEEALANDLSRFRRPPRRARAVPAAAPAAVGGSPLAPAVRASRAISCASGVRSSMA